MAEPENDPFRHFNSPPEMIRLVAMMNFPLSLRNVEDLLRSGGSRDILRGGAGLVAS